MKVAFRSDLKSKTVFSSKSYIHLKENKKIHLDFKFYQKLFVVFISLSTILIFPESPIELENICQSYHSKKSCNVW